jgi:hypothetical protein
MCLRRAPEKYIVGAALDRAALDSMALLSDMVTMQNHCRSAVTTVLHQDGHHIHDT